MNCDNCGGGICEGASEEVYIGDCVYHDYCVTDEDLEEVEE